MPGVARFRPSAKRVRAMSFQRPVEDRPSSNRPPPVPRRKSYRPTTRSFPNLSRFVERRASCDASNDASHTRRPNSFKNLSLRRSSAPPSQPLSTSTISSTSSRSHSASHTYPPRDPHSKHHSRRLLGKLGSSQRIRRLSFGHRSRKPVHDPLRASSFNETSTRGWASSGPSFLSHCSDNEDSHSWSRFLYRTEIRDSRMRRKRYASYSCSDFEIAEEPLVEIGERLPDRLHPIAEEDVFGRRRGDVKLEHSLDTPLSSTLECELVERPGTPSDQQPRSSPSNAIPATEGLNSFVEQHNAKPTLAEVASAGQLGPQEKEDTMRGIAKAIESSKGRLRRSMNMNKAFQAVIESGEGFVSKRQLVENILTTNDPKDPSMVILLEPEAINASVQGKPKDSTSSEDLPNKRAFTSSNMKPNPCVSFSTSMTAKQCAATLETILREMACRVTRYAVEEQEGCRLIRMKAVHVPLGTRRLERKVKMLVIIREEDRIRTSVGFKRITGLYSSRVSHEPLCADIRRRFQREWPAMVEALYVRYPEKYGTAVVSQ